jgi:hypothetical protein
MGIKVNNSMLWQVLSDSAYLRLLGQEEDYSLDLLYGKLAIKGLGNLLNKD